MSNVGIAVVSLIGLIVAWNLFTIFRSQNLKGNSISKTDTPVDAFIEQHAVAILYFYSVYCGQCVQQAKIIDALEAASVAVMKIDIGKQPALAQALNIRATPTVLVIKNKTIAHILLGTKPQKAIEALL